MEIIAVEAGVMAQRARGAQAFHVRASKGFASCGATDNAKRAGSFAKAWGDIAEYCERIDPTYAVVLGQHSDGFVELASIQPCVDFVTYQRRGF